jgi:carbamate kinase
MKKKVLVALGGNALLRSDDKGTDKEQLLHVNETCLHFVDIIKQGYQLAITHGNGPQVGNILLQNEMCQDKIPPMPLDICGAQSQGQIGYMIQRILQNRLSLEKIDLLVTAIISQVLVDKDDLAFKNPSKPIGPFYDKEKAENLQKTKGWSMVEQVGKGYRRVVPSPEPLDVIEKSMIKELFDDQKIVISCGGGGIPVIKEQDGTLKGIEGVIDKDKTASVLAHILKVDTLLILTDVEKVFINYKKENQKALDKLSIKEAEGYLKEGQFAKGSMGPKVEAAMRFLKGGGTRAIITSLEKAKDALNDKTGTHFIN